MSEQKVVIITGAAQGIGYAGARRFAEGGYRVILTDVKREKLDEAVKTLTDAGYDADGYELDITDYKRGQEVIADVVRKYDRIDVLFNNAGITGHRPTILHFDPEQIRQAEEVNLWGSLYMIQHVARVFVDKGIPGAIINVSSFVARHIDWSPFAYSLSKAAVDGLTRAAAFHLGKYGIRVNSVAPGCTKTEMATKYDYSDPVVRKHQEDRTLLHRWIEPEEIANAVFFLASDQASAITGVKLPVDAGYNVSKEDNIESIYGEHN